MKKLGTLARQIHQHTHSVGSFRGIAPSSKYAPVWYHASRCCVTCYRLGIQKERLRDHVWQFMVAAGAASEYPSFTSKMEVQSP